ncbi:MAG TPA: HDOD domain-containing protein [Sulfuriferula sp.]|nr:HDOD domain-containing protein [Sulfuriferula sp.]
MKNFDSIGTLPIRNPQKTLELLWKRIKQQGDLPGFAKVVNAIMSAIRGEDDREFNMTKTVLSDPALTQKVLRLANSAMYSVFGQDINTVSKAVLIVGTESIGHLALGSKLIDGLAKASAGSTSTHNEMEKAVLAGHIARQVTCAASARDAEEAVVCSMLHGLGRMMVTFYLPDHWSSVQARCAELGVNEAQATLDTLGLGLDEVGRWVAQKWGLPTALINSMQDVLPQTLGEPLDHADWLGAVATMSSRCARVLCDEANASPDELADIANSYADMLGMDGAEMLAAVQAAQESAAQDALFASVATSLKPEKSLLPKIQSGKPADAVRILTRGVADMRGVTNSATPYQLMTMALETVYQGLGLSRAIVFLRNGNEGKYFARMGFGEKVQELIPHLVFGEAYQPDVFHAGLANDKIIVVKDAKDPAFVSKLPRWWRDALPTTHSFVVLPLTANRHPAGFIYGDWDVPLPAAALDAAELLPLNELRKLMVQAIEQRSQLNPGLII